nr:glycine/sarcosine/betaine reductase component B subunit [Romboutsia hominis]
MLKEIGGYEHIKSIDIELAHPGESVRIVPVKDVIEPRVKVEGNGGIFPGIISKIELLEVEKLMQFMGVLLLLLVK